eukprot:TRINITY_DN1163_c0_g1_i3.p1 TRINITY_DN1163_c0_g1~~TRINITY_DN1163_c0_g1_i3.p1  ORF type:complete len:103 (+),score=23.71 TRINITY_DN1163_c0_g1_i3:78-386(+)
MVFYYCPGWYWDWTIFGDNQRNFNTREFVEGYHSHGLVRHSEDFQGNQAYSQKPWRIRAQRWILPPLTIFYTAWFLYWHRMYSQNARCPWGSAFDPSKEQAS